MRKKHTEEDRKKINSLSLNQCKISLAWRKKTQRAERKAKRLSSPLNAQGRGGRGARLTPQKKGKRLKTRTEWRGARLRRNGAAHDLAEWRRRGSAGWRGSQLGEMERLAAQARTEWRGSGLRWMERLKARRNGAARGSRLGEMKRLKALTQGAAQGLEEKGAADGSVKRVRVMGRGLTGEQMRDKKRAISFHFNLLHFLPK